MRRSKNAAGAKADGKRAGAKVGEKRAYASLAASQIYHVSTFPDQQNKAVGAPAFFVLAVTVTHHELGPLHQVKRLEVARRVDNAVDELVAASPVLAERGIVLADLFRLKRDYVAED